MEEVSKYEEKEKKYYITKKKKINTKAVVFLLIIPTILVLLLSILCIKKGISFDNKSNQIFYNENGKADYKVYLKENNYYDQKFLPKNMKYIASLINTINVNFDYNINSTEELDYIYKYKIDAKLVITEKNDNTKILYEKSFELLEEKVESIRDNNFVLNKNVDIDYDEYNNYVNTFKKDYALNIDSNLIITMNISTQGTDNKSPNKINTNNSLEVSIPLSEQTIDITINSVDINKDGSIFKKDGFTITNYFVFVLGILLLIIGILLIIVLISIYVSENKSKDIYVSTIDKYLKEYDRMIITSKRPNIDETHFNEVIRVMSIEELIDTHDITKQPIIYYEVVPGEKSYFIIINGESLYKLTISKAWLLKNMSKVK